jgi:hypothetical protein
VVVTLQDEGHLWSAVHKDFAGHLTPGKFRAMPDSISRTARHRERAMECRKISIQGLGQPHPPLQRQSSIQGGRQGHLLGQSDSGRSIFSARAQVDDCALEVTFGYVPSRYKQNAHARVSRCLFLTSRGRFDWLSKVRPSSPSDRLWLNRGDSRAGSSVLLSRLLQARELIAPAEAVASGT